MVCRLCPRNCQTERGTGRASGFCGQPQEPVISRAGLHHWEEPVISGTNGSGAVFFTGCNLKCVFCQNYDISTRNRGIPITVERLKAIYSEYELEAGEDSLWLKILDACEYLDAGHKELFMSYSSARRPSGKDEYLERFLAYFIYRHCTEALDADDFCARLSFCLFCERLFASLICAEGLDELCDLVALAVVISEELEYSDENTLALMRLNPFQVKKGLALQ